jgi:hypothetical protein
MRKTLLILVISVTPCMAQSTTQPTADDTKQGLFASMQECTVREVNLNIQLSAANRMIADLQKQLTALKDAPKTAQDKKNE